ncbi:MAG: adenine deaminase [Actinobacteria bacterium]|nr:adenine deaminase [Actinomycetota bacterium]
MDYEELYEIIQVARGDEPAEFVLKNAEIVNVFTGAFENADIAIHHGVIAGIGRYKGDYERDVQRSIVIPGFIDGHMHIETSMLRPEALAAILIKHGTTTAIVDPHEIANVAGLTGINYLLKATREVPIDFFFMAPSSVPSTPPEIETTGASVSRDEIAMLLSDPAFIGLGEVMDISGIMAGRPATLEKLIAAANDPIDGHAPEIRGKMLNAYLAAGPTSDHETAELDEGLEKIGRGMFLMVRESSVAKNLKALLPAVNYITSRNMAIVTDDRSLTDIIEEGHIDHIVRKAIASGIDIRLVMQMASLNPAQHFGLNDRGAVVPGRIADLLILEDITEVYIRTVIKNGIVVYDVGQDLQYIEKYEPPITLKNSIYVDKVTPANFTIAAKGKRARVVKLIPDEILTDEELVPPPIVDSLVTGDPHRDILKIAVINRYSRDINLFVGLLQGLGLRSGAIASSVAHDAHNLVVAGVDDEDIATAVNTIIDMQGGQVVVNKGEVRASLPLRIAGLIAEEDSNEVYDRMKILTQAAKDLGAKPSDPFMTLSFITLATVPKLKITDKGLVDVAAGKLVNLFV